ncbi:lung adenoma susceptibility protein 2 isoform X2 [Denticeps clupeoides]|uniref:lung adenoma susceptibility protein 2 isoform X2 n=1 Tax=Denticeps clupeoides TaxID=299321 RepID=UPI0010A42A8B|nr:lung adenoma susceptibility protein 2 isoform X2 [Denticeps clupeoides]
MLGGNMTSAKGLLSPESNVTSLFESSGHLRSGLCLGLSPHIRYGGKNYESASDALDAYISDFQQTSGTGKLEIVKDPLTPHLPRSDFRNKDVLKERLTDREINFLSLPVGTKMKDTDRLSMTTDDLLLVPCDGSLPVTCTSAFLSQSADCPLNQHSHSQLQSRRFTVGQGCCYHSQLCHRCHSSHGSRLSSFTKSFRHHSASEGHPQVSAVGGSTPTPHNASRAKLHPRRPAAASAALHYPLWLTSKKSEMDFSGVTSIPDLKYPAWLKESVPHSNSSDSIQSLCQISSHLVKEKPLSHEKMVGGSDELHSNQATDLAAEASDGSLRTRVRLQFRPSLENQTNAANNKPFREQALKSPSLGLNNQSQKGNGSPGGTEEILEGDHSWDNPPVMFKSPVPVGSCEDPLRHKETLTDSKEEILGSSSSGYSSRRHPGPVEALKQMLFSLQTVEHKVAQHKDPEAESRLGSGWTTSLIQNKETITDKECKMVLADCEMAPGEQSLQRALHHLGRLKSLVDDMNAKKEREQLEGAEHQNITEPVA